MGSSWRLIWRWGRRLVLCSHPSVSVVAEGMSTLVDNKGGEGIRGSVLCGQVAAGLSKLGRARALAVRGRVCRDLCSWGA